MSVLCLDTSSRHRLVSVVTDREGGIQRSDVREGATVGHALATTLSRMLADDIEAVVVVTGPGAYTGLRAGMSAALGVALARGVPLFGVATLAVVAAGWPLVATDGTVAVDAGRGAAYAADCTARSGGWAVGPARRVMLADLAARAGVLASPDQLAVPRLIKVDPVVALAAAVPAALAAPPLQAAGLTAAYVE